MKILSWNVHNDVTDAKKKHLEELKLQEKFDLLILQECTKLRYLVNTKFLQV